MWFRLRTLAISSSCIAAARLADELLDGSTGLARYMDDFVLCADDKETLRAAAGGIEGILDALGLRLKATATILAPTREGLPFVGWRIYRGTMRLRPQNPRRSRSRIHQRQWQHRCGRLDERRLADCVRSAIEHMRHGSTLALRRRWFEPDRRTGGGSHAPRTA